jgi:hypothetical protein
MTQSKPLRPACWKEAEMAGRKLELEQILSQQGVDICFN